MRRRKGKKMAEEVVMHGWMSNDVWLAADDLK
jgi:hypothetical protein